MNLLIDATRDIGEIRPLHGMDNGPVCFGGLIDSTAFYKAAGFPFVRLHDTNWPHPREVDIPQVFPDFSADPDDPASYDFRRTDEYLRQCLATGSKVIYRLGTSIEHTPVKVYTHPPAEAQKWATICLNLIRHVNEGWAGGHHMGIRYWEVWNEPDNQFFADDGSRDPMWSGSPEQYFELYAVTSRRLKEAFPDLMVGGYGASRLGERYVPYFDAFLDHVARERLPLDFFSWHRYAQDPEQVYEEARLAEAGLDRIGYSHTQSICDEWNYIPKATQMPDRPLTDGAPAGWRHAAFSQSASHEGTSFCTAVFARLHETRCAIATHYDGAPTNYYCTAFDRYGYPNPAYYAFVAFNELYKLRRRLPVAGQADGVYALAAGDGDALAMLVTSFRGPAQVDLRLAGLDPKRKYRLQKRLTDATHCHQLVEDAEVSLSTPLPPIALEKKATVLLTLTAVL